MTRHLPMQLRGPALNGTYEYGCLSAEFSGENLVGSNFSGSGNISGFRWSPTVNSATDVPLGTKNPPVRTQRMI